MKIKFIVCLLLGGTLFVSAQKKPLDHTVYDGWKQISGLSISPKGTFTYYEVLPQEGDGRLVFHRKNSPADLVIERGYSASLTPDEKFAVCLIKPFFKDTRAAKIKKAKPEDMPKDSIAIVSLKDGKVRKFSNILSYQLAIDEAQAVAFIRNDTSLIPKEERKQKEIGKPLLIYHFATGKTDTINYVDQYAFDSKGKTLVALTKDTTKKQSIELIDVANLTRKEVTAPKAFYSLPTFNEACDKFLYLASDDTASSGSKRCELLLYQMNKKEPELLIGRNDTTNFPENWALNENSRPYFSRNDNHIFVGIAPVQAPKDTTLVPFETASLDLWNYADKQLPPMQLKRLKEDLKRTCLAMYDPDKKVLMPLTTSFYDRIQLLDGGASDKALSMDQTRTVIESQWESQVEQDLSLVSLADGKRTKLATGKISRIYTSPDGGFIAWYDLVEAQWFLYDIAKQTSFCLTKKVATSFWDDENDVPEYADTYGIAGWMKNDQAILLYDKYDIWKFPTDGSKPENLTAGEGRKTNRIFRYLNVKERRGGKTGLSPISEKDFISPDEVLLLSVFDRTTKKQGYATLKLQKPQSPYIEVLDGYTFSQLKKAKNVEAYVYLKANFETSPNVYISHNLGKKEEKLSDINPQMKDYNWGTAELIKWNAYDGTPLEGLLYKPENFDPNKKYPVMIYFYERNSTNLYAYYQPSPSRSIINIPFYCSRGYIVFVPDIVYKIGLPGESAYNCIVSGAESLAKNPWVDKANMAIQGQSWGGYQVAYLVTRTNMFKAAGAGAPVSNMTSAYGGIRWGTGVSRQSQYEHTQSRIGRSLWEAPELYITNSPLFKADKVETPLLIMHNDADGAVPWYQGIEYFMALRRLGKKVWMLQYNNEEHNLTKRPNAKDLSIRLQQFFDYYLKGEPQPAWMKSGIPASKKGVYFGFENAE